MSFLDETFTGDLDRSDVAFWCLDRSRKGDFVQFLIDTEGVSRSRANQIWTQARQFHVGDTDTVTARPMRDRLTNYWNQRTNDSFGFTPTVIGDDNIQSVIASNSELVYRPRINSASSNAQNTYLFASSTGLEGLQFIGASNGYFIVYIPDNSPS